MPKSLRLICVALVALAAAGCESTRWNWLKRDTGDTAKKGSAAPNVKALVEYLNDNARRVNSVKVDDLDVDATMENQSFNLRGRIYAEKPKNFRMKVTLFGKDEVDVGSNKSEFWFWALKNPEKYQYFCSYDDLNAGRMRVTLPLPIQPEWIMEAMGLGPFGPAEKYELVPDGPNTVHLVEKAKSPQGTPVRKVIVMNRREMKAPQPQVTAFLLLDDATQQEICSAHIHTTTQDRSGAILPHRMELRMPSQKVSLKLRLDGMTVNKAIEATAFQRPQMVGVEPYNLATGRPEPWLQRAGGFK